MNHKILSLLLATFLIVSLSSCSKKNNDPPPSEDNPSSPSEAPSENAAPPEFSIPAPSEADPEPPEPEDELSPEDSEEEEDGGEEESSEPSRLSLTASATLTVDVLDKAGSVLDTPQAVSLPLPSSWTMDGSIIMMKGGKIGEVEPCRKIENPEDPFAGLSLPGSYGVFEAGGSSAVTWLEETNIWDQSAGASATIAVRHYYKAQGDLLYGMHFYLDYDGTKTISEATAVEVFTGLG